MPMLFTVFVNNDWIYKSVYLMNSNNSISDLWNIEKKLAYCKNFKTFLNITNKLLLCIFQ